jgi:hypothetical protein
MPTMTNDDEKEGFPMPTTDVTMQRNQGIKMIRWSLCLVLLLRMYLAVGFGLDSNVGKVSRTRRTFLITGSSVLAPRPVYALFEKDRRQLELCLVAVMRVVYWAENVSASLQQGGEQRQKIYLDAKLGAKAILTGKIGGGASGTVYTLSTLQVSGCLEDLEYYSVAAHDKIQEFREALASIVEFDGLDTLADASPRSSLTLAQYSNGKAALVSRILLERVVPTGRKLVNSYNVDAVSRSDKYIQDYYSSEIPRPVEETKAVSGGES